jgi:glycosyltransferase involved in cell wall biosynthesis
MKLLVLEERPRFVGGSERMSLAICQHALRRGHQAWLVHAEDGDMVAAYQAAGATTRHVPVVPMAARRPGEAWRSVRVLSGLVRREGIDVVFTSQVSYVSLLAAVGVWTGVRTVVHLGVVYDFPSPLFRTGMRLVSLGVTPSSHAAEGWRHRDWPAGRLRVIANGVDTRTFSPGPGRDDARRRLGFASAAGPVVAYVGRLVAEKGIFTLIRAFARGRDQVRSRLVLVGPAPADEVARLRACAREEGLPDEAWEVRAPTAAPEEVYRAADLVVVPSEWEEPFGLAPLEAMACGTPVIVSDRGLLPELVAPVGESAVFPAGDVDRLGARLIYWLEDESRRASAGARLMAHVRSAYAFEACGDAYLDAFAPVRRAPS